MFPYKGWNEAPKECLNIFGGGISEKEIGLLVSFPLDLHYL